MLYESRWWVVTVSYGKAKSYEMLPLAEVIYKEERRRKVLFVIEW